MAKQMAQIKDLQVQFCFHCQCVLLLTRGPLQLQASSVKTNVDAQVLWRLTCDKRATSNSRQQPDPVLVDKLTLDLEHLQQQLDVEQKHRQSLDIQVACWS